MKPTKLHLLTFKVTWTIRRQNNSRSVKSQTGQLTKM